jgi:hypothetical protein
MIDSSATYQQILAEYADTAAPFDSEAQCRRFIRAANLLLIQPAEVTSREGGTRFDRSAVEAALQRAETELAGFAGDSTTPQRTRVTRLHFGGRC